MTDSTLTNDSSGCMLAIELACALEVSQGLLTKWVRAVERERQWSAEEKLNYIRPHPQYPKMTIYTPLMMRLMSDAQALAASDKRMSFAEALSVLNGKQLNARTGELGRVLEARMDSFEARMSDIEKEMKEARKVMVLILTTLNQRLPPPPVVVAQPAPVMAAPVAAVVPARVERSAWGASEDERDL